MTTGISKRNVQSCPNCGQLMQVYRRSIRKAHVSLLKSMSKDRRPRKYNEIRSETNVTDFTIMKFWELIQEAKEKLHWEITDFGVAFVRGGEPIRKYVWIYNGHERSQPVDFENPMLYAYEIAPDIINKEVALQRSTPMPAFNAGRQGQGDMFQ